MYKFPQYTIALFQLSTPRFRIPSRIVSLCPGPSRHRQSPTLSESSRAASVYCSHQNPIGRLGQDGFKSSCLGCSGLEDSEAERLGARGLHGSRDSGASTAESGQIVQRFDSDKPYRPARSESIGRAARLRPRNSGLAARPRSGPALGPACQ